MLYLAVVDLAKGGMEKKHVRALEKKVSSSAYTSKAGSRSSKECKTNDWILSFHIQWKMFCIKAVVNPNADT